MNGNHFLCRDDYQIPVAFSTMHLTYSIFVIAFFSTFLPNEAKPTQLAEKILQSSDDTQQLKQAIKDLSDEFGRLYPVVQRIIRGSETGDCNAPINGFGQAVQAISQIDDIEQFRKDVAVLANRYNEYIIWTRQGYRRLAESVCGDQSHDPGQIEDPKSPQSIEQLTEEVKDISTRLETLKPIIQCGEQVMCSGSKKTTTGI